MNAQSEPADTPANVCRPLQYLFADLRIRYGIKLGLAATLALFSAQVLRLEHPSWAVLTSLILMLPKYVGASAVKACMRALGTIVGALVGIWLVGNFTSTPAIFLPIVFIIIAHATYKFGQFPASQFAYAHFLVGVTTIAVVTYGIADPDHVWQIGINRALEILVGVGSSLLVTALVWPRYAREEFAEIGRDSLRTMRQLFKIRTFIYRTKPLADAEQIHRTLDKQLIVLRNLLIAGTRESAVFSTRLSNYNAWLVSLIGLFHATLNIRQWSKETTFILNHLRRELEVVEETITQEFDILAAPRLSVETPCSSKLHEAFAAFEKRVEEIRDAGIFFAAPTGIAIEFAGHFGALRSVRDNLDGLRIAMEGLQSSGQRSPEAKAAQQEILPTIDWFWVRIGIKGGIAGVISILLLEWINPPGAASIPLTVWTLSLLGRSFLRNGGAGDLRAFRNAFVATMGLVICVGFLLLITPFLASYTLMNLALFVIVCTFGFLTAKASGLTFSGQISLLAISVFVGLNPQQPVSSQTIIGGFLGLIIGMWTGVVVGRLVWPVLPQRVLRDSLLAFFAESKALLRGDRDRERILSRLAILSVEALQAAQQIQLAGTFQDEKARIATFIRALRTLATTITELVSARSISPETTQPLLLQKLESLEAEFGQMLDAFAGCFRQGDSQRNLPSIRDALSEISLAIEGIRDKRILSDQKWEVPLQMLDLANRYHATTDAMEKCSQALRTLDIQRYWEDYAL